MARDGDAGDLKSRLPFPFNEDLSPVLVHLNRRTERGRAQLANDPVTAAYLAAALRLVERRLGPWGPDPAVAGSAIAGPASAASAVAGSAIAGSAAARTEAAVAGSPASRTEPAEHPLFGFLSQRAVAAAVTGNPDPFPRRGSVSTLRASWRTQSDFVADLLGFMLWTGYYPGSYTAALRHGADQLADAPDFAAAVQDLAYIITEHVYDMVSFRIQLAASLGAEHDPAVRAVLSAKYERGQAIWGAVYGRMIAARGLRLRPGIDLGQLADILTATVEGCVLRAIAEGPEVRVLDRAGRGGLLSVAAMTVVLGALETEGAEDGRSLADAVNALVTGRPPGSGAGAAAPAPADGASGVQGMPPVTPSD